MWYQASLMAKLPLRLPTSLLLFNQTLPVFILAHINHTTSHLCFPHTLAALFYLKQAALQRCGYWNAYEELEEKDELPGGRPGSDILAVVIAAPLIFDCPIKLTDFVGYR